MTPDRVLMGVFTGLSSPAYAARRKACRDSWMARVRELGFRAAFVFANGNFPTDYSADDCIALDEVPEGYLELPQKTRAFCQRALAVPNWEFLWKCDDDTFVHPERFADLCARTLASNIGYMGVDVGTRQGLCPYASGGAGYFLSRACVEVVAEKLVDQIGPEDLLVGRILSNVGARFDDRPDLFAAFSVVDGYPRNDNAMVTGHAMRECDWKTAVEHWKDGLR